MNLAQLKDSLGKLYLSKLSQVFGKFLVKFPIIIEKVIKFLRNLLFEDPYKDL
jgi:hypothetical protein